MSDGQLLVLTNMTNRIILQKMKQEQSFFCPQCNEPLILKTGSVKIPHFAHRNHSVCAALSEPESPKHLTGKSLLHSFFYKRHFKSCLEVYIPAITQRADLIVNGKHVIEYQCSSIPAQEVNRRTAGYRSAGFDPFWISGRSEPEKEGIQLLNLKGFEQELLKQQGFILFYNPDRNLFIYASNLYYVSGNRWVAKVQSLPAVQQVFPFARPRLASKPEFREIFLQFRTERDRFLRSQKFSGKNVQNPFWRVTYKMNLNPAHLPLFVGIPIPGAEVFRKHFFIWQLLALEAHFDADILIKSGKLTVAAGDELTARTVLRLYAECCQLLSTTESAEEAMHLLYIQSCKKY